MNAQQQLVITVMLMQPVWIQLDHLHVLVILDLLGAVSLVQQVSFIHSTKHENYNNSSILAAQWYPFKNTVESSYKNRALRAQGGTCKKTPTWLGPGVKK